MFQVPGVINKHEELHLLEQVGEMYPVVEIKVAEINLEAVLELFQTVSMVMVAMVQVVLPQHLM